MSLCIEPGKSVWVLYVDAICINYDGNAFDATLLAMVAALRDSKFGIQSSFTAFNSQISPITKSVLQ